MPSKPAINYSAGAKRRQRPTRPRRLQRQKHPRRWLGEWLGPQEPRHRWPVRLFWIRAQNPIKFPSRRRNLILPLASRPTTTRAQQRPTTISSKPATPTPAQNSAQAQQPPRPKTKRGTLPPATRHPPAKLPATKSGAVLTIARS